MPNNDTQPTCTTTLPSIFERLEALAPSDARDIRTAFEAVWENFYHLADCLQSAASRFRGEERRLLTAECERTEEAMGAMAKSRLKAIMPDAPDGESQADDGSPALECLVYDTQRLLETLTSEVDELELIEPGDIETAAINREALKELHDTILAASKRFNSYVR